MQFEQNPFDVRIEFLDGPAPVETVLHADARSLLERAQAVLDRAQTQAQAILREAREAAVQIRAESAHLGEAEKEALIQQTRDESVQQGLRWLVEEERLETALVDRVETRLRDLFAAVLHQWIDQQDQLAQLTHWLTVQMRDRAQHTHYRIRLPSDEYDVLVAHLAQNSKLEGIECIADARLMKGQAVIDTEFLRIEFDLKRHWKRVLSALKHIPESELD